MKKLFTLFTVLLLCTASSWADNTVTWSKPSAMSYNDFVALAGTGKTFALQAVSTNPATYNKWFSFTSCVNDLTAAQVFTLEGTANAAQIKRTSDAQYFSGPGAFGSTAMNVKLVNRTAGDFANEYIPAMHISFDNSAGGHYNATSYNFGSGAGGWSAYIAFQIFTISNVQFLDEDGNTLAPQQTNVLLPKGTLPTISGYDLTTDPTDGAGIQADGSYVFEFTKFVTVKYQVKNGDDVIWSKDIQCAAGKAYPECTINSWASVVVPEGIVSGDETKDVEYTSTIRTFADVASVDQWYSLDIHGNENNYPLYSDGKYIRNPYYNVPGTGYRTSVTPNYAWAFIGNPITGVKLYNKDSESYAVQANDSKDEKITMGEEGSLFQVCTCTAVANAFALKMEGRSYYFNHRNDYIQGWDKADGGSAIRAYAVTVNEKADLTAMKAAVENLNSRVIGTTVGQYHETSEGAKAAALAEAAKYDDTTSWKEQSNVDAATALLNSALANLTINQPQVGHTYAFKGAADSHQYMIDQSSTVTGKTNRLALTATPTGNSHVFTLLEGNKLQSYTSEKKYLVSTDENTKGYLNVGDEANAVSFEFVASESQIGAYQLKYTYSTYVRTVWSMQTGYVDGADFPNADIGYQWIIEEVEPKPTSNIIYQITEGETVKWEETIKAVIGDPYPTPTFSHPFVSALVDVPDGIVQDHDETFQLRYTTKYDIATDVNHINKYYALDIHATSGNFPMYSDGQVLRKESTSIDVSKYAQGSADHIYAWAFVGNIFDGIKLYNKEDQKYVCQSADNSNTQVSMTSDPDAATAFTVYNPIKTVSDSYPGAFCLKKSDFSNYLNTRGGFVCGWTSADGGSAIRAYEISTFTDATADLFDRMKNTKKFVLVAGAVVVSPREYAAPSEINAAIDEANAILEPATRIEKKNFITDDPSGQKLYTFLVQSDLHGDPVVVTYEQKRPYGTLILPINFKCPTGWTRYCCDGLDGGRLVLTDFSSLGIGETKNRPFIIYSPETIGTTYQFIGYSGGALTEDVKIGLLTGVLSDGGSLGGSLVPQGSYVLAYHKQTGVQSFRKTDGSVVCPQYKVYLTKSALAESRDNFYFPDVDDSATGLEELLEQSVLADGKYVRDGRVIIVKNGVKYNTNGQIIK